MADSDGILFSAVDTTIWVFWTDLLMKSEGRHSDLFIYFLIYIIVYVQKQ